MLNSYLNTIKMALVLKKKRPSEVTAILQTPKSDYPADREKLEVFFSTAVTHTLGNDI